MPAVSIHRPILVRRSSAYASLECRFAAFLIDTTLFVFIQSFVIYILIGYPDTHGIATNLIKSNMKLFTSNLDYLGLFLYTNLYFVLIHWLYYAFMESSRHKGTLGKKVLGLKVSNLNGGRIDFIQASIRYFGKFFSIGTLFMGFLMAVTNTRHQTLHDIISGCTVRVKRVH